MEIKEIVPERPVSGQYLIVENQLKTAKNGNSYLALKIADSSGELGLKIWDANQELFQLLEVGQVLELENILPKTYKEQLQLDFDSKSNSFRIVPEEQVDYSKFLPRSPGNLAGYWEFISKVIAAVSNPQLKRLLSAFFDDPGFVADFMRVPAALKRHHAYIGGLVEHTAGVTSLCQAAADYYPMVNRDLLLAGSILHDIGKVKTYKLRRGIEGTDQGKLIGHLVLGVEMVQQMIAATFSAAEREREDSRLLWNSLIHLLVSHHGIMEWGSPVEPLTLEACVLHHADNMDAQIAKFLVLIRNEGNNKDWTNFDTGLGRSIFVGGIQRDIDQSQLLEGA